MSVNTTLCVACLLPAPKAPAWMLQTLQDVQAANGIQAQAFGVQAAVLQPAKQSLKNKLDQKWFAQAPDPLALKPLPLDCNFVQGQQLEQTLKTAGFDLILDLAGWTNDNNIPLLRYGVWKYHFLRQGQDIKTLLVAGHIKGTVPKYQLYHSLTSISPLSVCQNRAQLYWKCCWFAGRALQKLLRYSGFVQWGAPKVDTAGSPLQNIDFEVYKNIAQLVCFRLFKYRGRQDVWWIRLYKDDVEFENLADTPFYDVSPPPDRFWADPFIFKYEGKSWLFMEELPYSTDKGYISVCQINGDGTCTKPMPIIEEEWHLSYPFVFEWQGKLYLVPESSAAKTVDLYECIEFPYKWQKKKSLLSGMHFADNTLFCKDDLWWMFTSVTQDRRVHNRDELFLFYTDNPVDGEWKEHPQNPVVSNSRTARPGGQVIQKDGRWFRISQDNSLRYGYGVVMSEINACDTQNYAESPAKQFHYSLSQSGIAGVHTYNRSGGWTAIDLLRWKKR